MVSSGSMEDEKINQLLKLGVLVEGLTFPDLIMPHAIDNVLASPALVANLSATLEPRGITNLNESLYALSAYLDTAPHDTNLASTYASMGIVSLIAVITVALRVYARTKLTKKMWPEDWWAVASAFSITILVITFFLANHIGRGSRHLYDLSFNDLRKWQLTVNIACIAFSICLLPIKFTFAVFYYRICIDKWYRRILVAVMISIVAISIAGVFLWVFQSTPIDFWNHNLNPDLKYINRVEAQSIWGGITAAQDVILLILPIWKVSSLKIRQLREKIIVIGMFGAGILICIANILRVVSLNKTFNSMDGTFHMSSAANWAIIELDGAVIISSFPALKHLIFGRKSDRYKISKLASKIIRSVGPERKKGPSTIPYYNKQDLCSQGAKIGPKDSRYSSTRNVDQVDSACYELDHMDDMSPIVRSPQRVASRCRANSLGSKAASSSRFSLANMMSGSRPQEGMKLDDEEKKFEVRIDRSVTIECSNFTTHDKSSKANETMNEEGGD